MTASAPPPPPDNLLTAAPSTPYAAAAYGWRNGWEAGAAAEREHLAGMADRLAATIPSGDGRLSFAEAIRQTRPETGPEPAPAAAPLPDGEWGRIEFPGYRSDTGWITDGTRGGQTVLVVRNWDGCPLGEYVLGPGCRLVLLPTPMKRPEPQPALPAGGFGVRACMCGPDDECEDCARPF